MASSRWESQLIFLMPMRPRCDLHAGGKTLLVTDHCWRKENKTHKVIHSRYPENSQQRFVWGQAGQDRFLHNRPGILAGKSRKQHQNNMTLEAWYNIGIVVKCLGWLIRLMWVMFPSRCLDLVFLAGTASFTYFQRCSGGFISGHLTTVQHLWSILLKHLDVD